MKKYRHISSFLIIVSIFVIGGFLFPNTALACEWYEFTCNVMEILLPSVAEFTIRGMSLLTGLAGIILNAVIYYTIVDIANNYSRITTINEAWSVIRDLANMSFIFVLLYAAIKTILGTGSDTKNLIVKIIVVAILINFSLFFTKVVIDASNVLAIAFYDAIVPGAFDDIGVINLVTQTGISHAFMQNLNLQSLYEVGENGNRIGPASIVTLGIMGSIMLLIAAFIFFAVALMFIIRYVILILVLILSPLAFIAFVLPQLEKYKAQWIDALVGQAFFAPIYFMLTWVTLHVLGGITSAFGATDNPRAALSGIAFIDSAITGTNEAFGLLINFIVVIVFLVASLILAKELANKVPGGVNKLTGWATATAGGATLGMAGRFGRNVIGSRAATMANDENLKQRASEGSMRAKLQLAAANKATRSSFDLRATRLGDTLDAGKVKKGTSFIEDQKERAKTYEKYKPSKNAIEEARKAEDESRKKLNEASENAVSKSDEHRMAAIELELLKRSPAEGLNQGDLSARSIKIQNAQEAATRHEEDLIRTRKEYAETSPELKTERSLLDQNEKTRKDVEDRMKNMEEKMKNSKWAVMNPIGGLFVSGKVKAQAIRAAGKGKSPKEEFADAAKKLADAEKEGEEKKEKDEKKQET